jgi:hypothetical protein
VELQLHSLLTSTLDVFKWPTARPGRFEDSSFMALFSGTHLSVLLPWFMFLRGEAIAGICIHGPVNGSHFLSGLVSVSLPSKTA